MKRVILFSLFFWIFSFTQLQPQSPAPPQEKDASQSSLSQIITLKYGFNFGGVSSNFYDTYNNYNSFPRPLIFSETKWTDFEKPQKHSVFGAEAGLKINNKISVGVAGEYHTSDVTDELTYTGIVELIPGVPEDFRNITEQHQFKTKAIHLLSFFDYRLFGKRALSPVVGLGIGVTFSSIEWNWNIEGKSVIDNTLYLLSDDQVYMNIDNKLSFLIQPRIRLEYSFPASGFFNSVFLQTDYIFSKYDADYFENFRDLALDGQPFESLPQQLQIDAIKKLYDHYDVNPGGFELMVGLTLKFKFPEISPEDK